MIPLLRPALVTFPALSTVMNITNLPLVLQLCVGSFPAFPIVPGMKPVRILSFPILVILSSLESESITLSGVEESSFFASFLSSFSVFGASFFSSFTAGVSFARATVSGGKTSTSGTYISGFTIESALGSSIGFGVSTITGFVCSEAL